MGALPAPTGTAFPFLPPSRTGTHHKLRIYCTYLSFAGEWRNDRIQSFINPLEATPNALPTWIGARSNSLPHPPPFPNFPPGSPSLQPELLRWSCQPFVWSCCAGHCLGSTPKSLVAPSGRILTKQEGWLLLATSGTVVTGRRTDCPQRQNAGKNMRSRRHPGVGS